MTATKRKKLNPRVYGELLLDVLPRPIQTEAENERALAVVDRLMSKGEDNLMPEETTLLELLVQLIERFEEKAYPKRLFRCKCPDRSFQFVKREIDGFRPKTRRVLTQIAAFVQNG